MVVLVGVLDMGVEPRISSHLAMEFGRGWTSPLRYFGGGVGGRGNVVVTVVRGVESRRSSHLTAEYGCRWASPLRCFGGGVGGRADVVAVDGVHEWREGGCQQSMM